ncbi:MAG: class I SAM-dependent methyltransferase [Euryarchaeota archaeon]|nr:class I SAM-dependent methyltransferase [Euryarchaeota archaeon]
MTKPSVTSEEQLRRQLAWLGESWHWIMRTKVLRDRSCDDGRPTALDVGCGPGLVMEMLSPLLDVKGVDIDPDMVRTANGRGMDAVQGDAMDLPFEDGSFDISYCSFTLLWVKDPALAMKEMARVSRRYVICLAEPDYGGRICHPKEVADLDGHLTDSLIEEGADPFIGRRLAHMMEMAGLAVDQGVHSGVWSPSQMREEAEAEWSSISKAVGNRADERTMERARSAWDKALADGSLFLFNPMFYAIGRKP